MGAATSTCPACGADSFVRLAGATDGAGTCSRCGFASGEANRCPHCHVVARIEGSGKRARCASCGAPRIAGNLGGDTAKIALVEQAKALVTARLASIATVIQGLLAAVVTVIGMIVHPETPMGRAIAFGIALVPLLFAITSRVRAGRARAKARAAGDRAWQAAAEDVAARSEGGVTAASLASTLGIAEAEAEQLLTSLTVHERTRIDVGDDAEVRYSARPDALAAENDAFSTDEASTADEPKLKA